MQPNRQILAGLVVGVVISGAIYSAFGPRQPAPAAAAAAAPPARAPQPAPAPAPAPAPPPPDHHYVMQADGMYGYQPGVSAAARETGQAAIPLVMMGFNGERNGEVQMMQLIKPSTVLAITCSEPCAYYRQEAYIGSRHTETRHMPAVPGTIGWSALQDARSGKLTRYVGKGNVYVWCTEQGGCKSEPARKR